MDETTEIERLKAALAICEQALNEVDHAQRVGPEWYTRGSAGLRSQVSMWVGKGQEAIRSVRASTDGEDRQ